MHYISRYAPVLIGLLFTYSGAYKLLLPAKATAALVALGATPAAATATVGVITVIEVYLGIILLVKVDLKFGLLASVCLLLVFSAFLFHLSTMAHPPSCGCMGLGEIFSSNRHSALFGLFRNCVLLWLLKIGYDHYCGGRAVGKPKPA